MQGLASLAQSLFVVPLLAPLGTCGIPRLSFAAKLVLAAVEGRHAASAVDMAFATLKSNNLLARPLYRYLFVACAFYSDAVVGKQLCSWGEVSLGLHIWVACDVADAEQGLRLCRDNAGVICGGWTPMNRRCWRAGRIPCRD